MKSVLTALVAYLVCCQVQAGVTTLEKYQEVQKAGGSNWTDLRLYVTGLGDGIMIANAKSHAENGKYLFCVPPKLPLGIENYTGMIDGMARDYPGKLEQVEIGPILMRAFMLTFPCE